MILLNNTLHAFCLCGHFVVPGSNSIPDEKVDLENPVVQSWLDCGDLEIVEKMDEKKAVEVINKTNDQSILGDIEKNAPKSEKVKSASKARRQMLDDFDAEVKAAIEKQKQKKAEAEG